MYQFNYAEVLEDAEAEGRDRDGRALDRSVELLRLADASGAGTPESTEALSFATRLWMAFIEDLGMPENDLPKELRAGLISIGLWILREAERIRAGQAASFKGMIEISAMVREGLR